MAEIRIKDLPDGDNIVTDTATVPYEDPNDPVTANTTRKVSLDKIRQVNVSAYSNSRTYKVGDVVRLLDAENFICTTAITTGEPYDKSKWEPEIVSLETGTIEADVDNVFTITSIQGVASTQIVTVTIESRGDNSVSINDYIVIAGTTQYDTGPTPIKVLTTPTSNSFTYRSPTVPSEILINFGITRNFSAIRLFKTTGFIVDNTVQETPRVDQIDKVAENVAMTGITIVDEKTQFIYVQDDESVIIKGLSLDNSERFDNLFIGGIILENEDGTVKRTPVTAGGSGYTSAPTVSFVGGSGSGAAATAVITGDIVTAVNITNEGSGYTSAPTISFSGGGGTGAAADAVIQTLAIETVSEPDQLYRRTLGERISEQFAGAKAYPGVIIEKGSSGGLTVGITAGTLYRPASNYENNKNIPYVSPVAAVNPLTFTQVVRINATGNDFEDTAAILGNTIDIDNYNPNNTLIPVPSTGPQFQIFRLYFAPGRLLVFYGTQLYEDLDTAVRLRDNEAGFNDKLISKVAAYRGFIVTRRGLTTSGWDDGGNVDGVDYKFFPKPEEWSVDRGNPQNTTEGITFDEKQAAIAAESTGVIADGDILNTANITNIDGDTNEVLITVDDISLFIIPQKIRVTGTTNYDGEYTIDDINSNVITTFEAQDSPAETTGIVESLETINILEGRGIIVDHSTPGENSSEVFSWNSEFAVPISGVGAPTGFDATKGSIYVIKDSTGTTLGISVDDNVLSQQQIREQVLLGVVKTQKGSAFTTETDILAVQNQKIGVTGPRSTTDDYHPLFTRKSGGKITQSDPTNNFQVKTNVGTIVGRGINFNNNMVNPNIINTPALDPIGFYLVSQRGFETSSTVNNPDRSMYDNGTILVAVGGANFSLQRLWFDPPSLIYYLQYGTAEYNQSQVTAKDYENEQPSPPPGLPSTSFVIASLLMKNSGTGWNSDSNNELFNSDVTAAVSNEGGGGGATLELNDLTDVTITPPTINDLLVSDVEGAWLNREGVFSGITGLGQQTQTLDFATGSNIILQTTSQIQFSDTNTHISKVINDLEYRIVTANSRHVFFENNLISAHIEQGIIEIHKSATNDEGGELIFEAFVADTSRDWHIDVLDVDLITDLRFFQGGNTFFTFQAGILRIGPTLVANEGGQIDLVGEGTNDTWSIDSFTANLRIFTAGNTKFELSSTSAFSHVPFEMINNDNIILNNGDVEFNDTNTTIGQTGPNMAYDVATGGLHRLRVNNTAILTVSGSDVSILQNLTLNNNNLTDAIMQTSVVGVSGITGLGNQTQDLDMGANGILGLKLTKRNISAISGGSGLDIDFNNNEWIKVDVDETTSFSTSNITAGKKKKMFLIGNSVGGPFNITFPGFVFIIGSNSESLPANKTALVELLSLGTTEGEIIATYQEQP